MVAVSIYFKLQLFDMFNRFFYPFYSKISCLIGFDFIEHNAYKLLEVKSR